MKTENLYVHIPFCDNICTYCDFAKVYYSGELADRYLVALFDELRRRAQNRYKTIYIGGGTPSALDESQLETLLQGLQDYLEHGAEFTIEANPESLKPGKIALLKKYRVNRVSLGVQTFNEDLLQSLNRRHNNAMVDETVALLKKAGIANINIDLMYGLKGQTMADIKNDLDHLINLDVPHVSYYSLILEEHTMIARESYPELEDESLGEISKLIDGCLEANGYKHYEVSNYAKLGFESRHNLAYWHYCNYLGVGVGAASKIDDRIIQNNRNLYKYLGGENIQEVSEQSQKETMFNHIMMSLRLKEGLDLEDFNQRYQVDFEKFYRKVLAKHLGHTMMIRDGFLVLSKNAYDNLNSILVDFL